jgi:hypothetical protein
VTSIRSTGEGPLWRAFLFSTSAIAPAGLLPKLGRFAERDVASRVSTKSQSERKVRHMLRVNYVRPSRCLRISGIFSEEKSPNCLAPPVRASFGFGDEFAFTNDLSPTLAGTYSLWPMPRIQTSRAKLFERA